MRAVYISVSQVLGTICLRGVFFSSGSAMVVVVVVLPCKACKGPVSGIRHGQGCQKRWKAFSYSTAVGDRFNDEE